MWLSKQIYKQQNNWPKTGCNQTTTVFDATKLMKNMQVKRIERNHYIKAMCADEEAYTFNLHVNLKYNAATYIKRLFKLYYEQLQEARDKEAIN